MTRRQRRRLNHGVMLVVLGAAIVGVAWMRLTQPVQRDVSPNGVPVTTGEPVPPLPDMRLDLNRAPASELTALPGIGPTLAGRIVANRRANGPFDSLDDLARVKWIGPSVIERIKPYVVVKPPGDDDDSTE